MNEYLAEEKQVFLKTLFQLLTQQTSQSSNFFALPSLSKDSKVVYRYSFCLLILKNFVEDTLHYIL